jgi:hypothetical protein
MPNDRMMGPLENWTWVLAEARANVGEAHRAPLVAVRTYEVWANFISQRGNEAHRRRAIDGEMA